MEKDKLRIDLSEMARKPGIKEIAMLEELEGRSESDATQSTWAQRFIAVGGKRASMRR